MDTQDAIIVRNKFALTDEVFVQKVVYKMQFNNFGSAQVTTLLYTPDTQSHIMGLVALRKLLEVDENLDGAVEQQILGPIFKIIRESNNNCLLYEATWCVILISLGPEFHVQALIDRGIL